jgi:hypothetical protein
MKQWNKWFAFDSYGGGRPISSRNCDAREFKEQMELGVEAKPIPT